MIALAYCEACGGVTVLALKLGECEKAGELLEEQHSLRNGASCGTIAKSRLPEIQEELTRVCKACGTSSAIISCHPIFTALNVIELHTELGKAIVANTEGIRFAANNALRAAARSMGKIDAGALVALKYRMSEDGRLRQLQDALGALHIAPPVKNPYYVKHGEIVDRPCQRGKE